MFNLLYSRIYDHLLQFKEESDRLNLKIKKAESIYQNTVSEAKQLEQKRKTELDQIRAKLNAFISMAKAHTNNLTVSKEPRPIDIARLSNLSLRINPSVPNDTSASLLYIEATGQLKTLQLSKPDNNDRVYLAETALKSIRSNVKKELANLRENLIEFFRTNEDFRSYINKFKASRQFDIGMNTEALQAVENNFLVGYSRKKIPTPPGCADVLEAFFGKYYYDEESSVILVPLCYDILSGGVFYMDYYERIENVIFSSLFCHLIDRIAAYWTSSFRNVIFFDPTHYNGSALGIYETLSFGKNSFIEPIPTSHQELDAHLDQILQSLNKMRNYAGGNAMPSLKKVFIFHNFPEGYSASSADKIRQICMNAKYYKLPVILTHCVNSDNRQISSSIESIVSQASIVIKYDPSASRIRYFDTNLLYDFNMISFNYPTELPQYFVDNCINQQRNSSILSNDYNERIGFLHNIAYNKGIRYIDNIPLGIEQDGSIVSISFENENFATFICGASRSGKSTLLHSILTSIIQKTHPDDIEIWLIDFKMTEFSRYIEHMPPHIRYIMLDESPELVYDIIDRLTDILQKRQNMFKGRWQKLYNVPAEKYMPAILVVIDEFSVMSKIIAESALTGTVNYKAKLDTLLAKGAALGLHFIFASQGFTSGTAGLSDFAKKQIQQRIAMKTEYLEIKETLDLKSASDEDRALMEQLEPHHALLRIPPDANGNHLSHSKVIYISDYTMQEDMIDLIASSVTPVDRFNPQDLTAYIHKQPVIVDGNTYQSFSKNEPEFVSHLNSYRSHLGENSLLFVGEPRRMKPICPIEISDSFMENILMVAPNKENAPAASVVLSAIESLKMQGYTPVICANKKNPVFQQIKQTPIAQSIPTICGSENVCDLIKQIKVKLGTKIHDKEFYILLGFESILLDMANYKSSTSFSAQSTRSEAVTVEEIGKTLYYQPRDKSKPDFMTQLAQLTKAEKNGKKLAIGSELQPPLPQSVYQDTPKLQYDTKEIYDARTDLKHLFEVGPNNGYHFMLVFNTVGEISQHRIDLSHFKHRISFKDSTQNARVFFGNQEASVVFNLEDHCFRYSDGIYSCSYRPYLHKGLTWDNWTLDDAGEVTCYIPEEEEYLL